MPVGPTDALQGVSSLAQATVLDFWSWAFGDLSDDDVKGFFAEWLVHKLLDVPSHRRVSWANSDIITPGQTRIEVKSTAHWQSWKYIGEDGFPLSNIKYPPRSDDTRIRFAGLKARNSTDVVQEGEQADFKSHFYVFAFQHETDLNRWNALDLAQWEFYWVPVNELRKLGCSSISLRTLRRQFGSLTAEQLATVGRSAIVAFEASR